MKVLAINSNYQNQNHKKGNVNFEAVRVDADAIDNFREIAKGAGSLSTRLVFQTLECFMGVFGKKVVNFVKNSIGISSETPLEQIFTHSGLFKDFNQIKQDVFLSAEESGKLGQLITKAEDETKFMFYGNSQVPTMSGLFDELWEQEGTACHKLRKTIEGFVADANADGHHVTKEDTLVYLEQFRANEKAKEQADEAVYDAVKAKWFAPKPATES